MDKLAAQVLKNLEPQLPNIIEEIKQELPVNEDDSDGEDISPAEIMKKMKDPSFNPLEEADIDIANFGKIHDQAMKFAQSVKRSTAPPRGSMSGHRNAAENIRRLHNKVKESKKKDFLQSYTIDFN